MTTYDQLQGTRYQTVRALARGGMTARTLPLAAAVPRRTLALVMLGTTAVVLGLFLAAARTLGAL